MISWTVSHFPFPGWEEPPQRANRQWSQSGPTLTSHTAASWASCKANRCLCSPLLWQQLHVSRLVCFSLQATYLRPTTEAKIKTGHDKNFMEICLFLGHICYMILLHVLFHLKYSLMLTHLNMSNRTVGCRTGLSVIWLQWLFIGNLIHFSQHPWLGIRKPKSKDDWSKYLSCT